MLRGVALTAITCLLHVAALAQTINISPLPFNLDSTPGGKPAPAAAAQPATPPPLPTAQQVALTGTVGHIYVYVEPFQTRIEALFDITSIIQWLTPDEKNVPDTISVEYQQSIIRDAEKLAADWCSVSTNEGRPPYIAPTAHFVKGKPGATIPIAENEALPRNQCMLGLVWNSAATETPDTVEATWKGWINGAKVMPVTVLFGTQSERSEINNITKKIQWINKGRLRPTPLAKVPTYEPVTPINIPIGAILWLLIGICFYWYIWHRNYRLPGGGLPYFGVYIFCLILIGKLVNITIQRDEGAPNIADVTEAQKIVSPLLRNVYRAFDHRAESRIYDVLHRSIEGELLRKLYLETITALTLDGREGTRVLITEFEATVDQVTGHTSSGGFIADCNWSTIGTVGHWGHAHPRYNGYKARVTVEPLQGEWKLTALEVQEVRRK